MIKKDTKNYSSGFTLIEVMIAIAILSFIVMGVSLFTQSTLNNKEMTERLDNLNHSAFLALHKMSMDLQMAFLLSGPDFLGTDGKIKTVFKGSEDQLNFVSFSHVRYFKEAQEADYGEVGYFLEDSKEEGGGKNLMRRESKVIDDNPEEGGTGEVLIDGIKEFHLEYYDSTKKEWGKNWDSTQLDFSNRLPMAVKIEIEIQDPSGDVPLHFSTIADIKIFAQPISF